MEKYTYLPEASGTSDFIILGSKPGFAAMLAIFIAAVCLIIYTIRKNKK